MPEGQIIDLRSDTVTQPDDEMRAAMACAVVGDDVYGDDPTVNALESHAADLLGKEMAVLFPTGTQSNLAAILTHCERGDELLVGGGYHVRRSEAGGASVLGGVVMSPLPTLSTGAIDPRHIDEAACPDSPTYPRTRLVSLENTVAGQAISLAAIREVVHTARRLGLAIHLDGARIFNACAELGVRPIEMTELVDTVSVCLSKGLGAPAGTLLAGPRSIEHRLRRNRKILGGGMRQTGIIAAAGLHALQHNIARLEDDHHRARKLADCLLPIAPNCGLGVRQATNMVFLTVRDEYRAALHPFLAKRGIRVGHQVPEIRMVLHLGVSDADVECVGSAFRDFFATDPTDQADERELLASTDAPI